MSKQGYFVISLDFELYWGMFDKVSLPVYGENIKSVHTVIPELLALFEANDIHATWATVGMLMHKNKTALLAALPEKSLQPEYSNPELSSYHHIENSYIGADEFEDPHHFGASLINQILETKGQELASHTFSHYYCIDGSKNSGAIFAADCKAMRTVVTDYTTSPSSIIFPRNQTNNTALKICKENGITAYRGTEKHFLYNARKESAQTNLFIRGLRLLDHYINISGNHTYPLTKTKETLLTNIPASRFLRPYSQSLRFLETLRLRRIKRAMTHAAKYGEIFHLWWHPHNFGSNRKENMQNLMELLNHYKTLKEEYDMGSKNMRDIEELTKTLSE